MNAQPNHNNDVPSPIDNRNRVAINAARRAVDRIAPVWPLDKSVAVNPWWHWRERPIAQVAARLRSLKDIRMLMPKAYYRRHWQQSILPEHLLQAAAELDVQLPMANLVDYLDQEDYVPVWKNLSDWCDNEPEQAHKMPWGEEITQQISQTCGLFFSYPDRAAKGAEQAANFYTFWHELVRQDAGITILMGEPELQGFLHALPTTPEALISGFYRELQTHTAVDETEFEAYCLALMLDINGWASVFAQRQWLQPVPDSGAAGTTALLAVRMAWEWSIWRLLDQRGESGQIIQQRFVEQLHQNSYREAHCHQSQTCAWVWQRALELSAQQPLQTQLLAAKPAPAPPPSLQAVFCIDVRSEPMRRALESISPDIQTLGFAGFFGLGISYDPHGLGLQRPQLPALLTPSLCARPTLQRKPQLLTPLWQADAASKASGQASANFGWVEAKGLFDGIGLLRQSFGRGHASNPQERFEHIDGWELWAEDKPLGTEQIATLLAGVLQHMGLRDNFAERILLVAHASCTANNALAAGLDCGACGGQSGQVNVRVLAYFLNLAPVREALRALGIHIPASSRFVPCLHNTTSDDIEWFHCPSAPANKDPEVWQGWLIEAADVARAARAPAMAIESKTTTQRHGAFKQLTRDWAQLRPEWGLANNAAFVVAPRRATRSLDLNGRAFLHDYQWQSDTDFATLELIITAPMVVTHWINFQYNASMTDTQRYGSGNKLLHNVVGGNLGVFEGNGGDLRIGLPLQSLHDGQDWRHQPVRLSVYLAAPRQAIAAIVERHPDIAALINNDWLYLYQWAPDEQHICRYYREQWHALPASQLASQQEQVA